MEIPEADKLEQHFKKCWGTGGVDRAKAAAT